MSGYYRVPLLFFTLAAGLGLFLRWQFVMPTPGVRYTYFLHGHSHVMFLGWVFNVLYLSFVEYHIPHTERHGFLKLFLVLQILVVAMMISFPVQGYGLYSIVFSTLHTLAVLGFISAFFRRTRTDQRISTWFARTALVFFFISTAGPFSLGYLMSAQLGQTNWFNFSIYYYLHFQYNGFFLFGIFSLFFQLLETKQIEFPRSNTLSFGKLSAFACVPAYSLSILFARPGLFFNVIGALACIIQLAALSLLLRDIIRLNNEITSKLTSGTIRLFQLALLGLIVKNLLQLASALPDIAELAYSQRNIVIAYIHLVLVGVITFFLLGWYLEKNLVNRSRASISAIMLLTGFVASEVCLILPRSGHSLIAGADSIAVAIFTASILMFIGAALFFVASMRKSSG